MEQDDGPGLNFAGYPLDDFSRGQVFPVQAVHIPLDGFHTDGPHSVDGVVIVVAIGQADQGGADPGDLLDFVIAGVQVGGHSVGGELGVVGVGVGVVHDLVARVVEGLY